MARRIYASTTSTSVTNRHLLDEMQSESDRLLNDFRTQLAREVTSQLSALAQNGGSAPSLSNLLAGNNDDASSSRNLVSFFSTAVRYLLQPSATRTSQQTSRSAAAQQQFRLSASQAAAQANAQLAAAQKNT